MEYPDSDLFRLRSNKSRVAALIVNDITDVRKLLGTSEVLEDFRTFSDPASPSQLYIIHNSVQFFGYNRVLQELHFHLQDKKKVKQEDRTPADAIRVAAVMLSPENLKTVSMMLSGTRASRASSDQAVDPQVAWAMDAVVQFKDPTFDVPMPDDIDPEDVDGVDPNDEARIAKPRGAKWLLQTWKVYLKKKYKDAIRKWDTMTGGGSHEPREFCKFCNSDKWLVWIYLMDMKAGFLLFSVAKGKPSEYVGCEPGSDVCLHLLASDDTGSAAATTNEEGSDTLHPRKRSAIACARKDFEARQVQMGSLLQSASDWFQKRANDAERREEETRKRAAEFERDCLLLPSTSVCGGASNCFPNPSSEVSLI